MAAELRVGVRELRSNLTRYLRAAQDGTSVLVTSRAEVIAEIRSPASSSMQPRRRPGRLRGQIVMADDFDTLPDDILNAMES